MSMLPYGTSIGLMGLDPFAQGVMDRLSFDYEQRRKLFRRAQMYYRGKCRPPLKTILTPDGLTIDDNVFLNYCKPIVDKSVDFLFGKGITVSIHASTPTEEEDFLNKVLDANKKEIFLRQLAMSGAIFGHAFIKIEPPDAALGEEYPRLLLLPPEDVFVEWSPHDVTQVLRYCIQYDAYDPESKKPRTYRQKIEPINGGDAWKITDSVLAIGKEVSAKTRANGGWIDLQTTIWPHKFPPIVDCQNLPAANEYWGTPDLDTDQLDLQDSINFIVSNITRIIRFHAHPKTWGRGFNASQMQTAINEMIVVPGKDATLQNLEMHSDLHSSIMLLQELRSSFFAIARVPETVIFRLDNVSRLTGIAVAMLYQPLIDKTLQKRATYGEMIIELCQRVLQLMGYEKQDNLSLSWPEMLQEDPQVKTATILQQVTAKVLSRTTATKEFGYDPEIEKPLIEQDIKEDNRQQQVLTDMQTQAQIDILTAQAKLQGSAAAPSPTGPDTEDQATQLLMQHTITTAQSQQTLDNQKDLATHQSQLKLQEQEKQAKLDVQKAKSMPKPVAIARPQTTRKNA